MLSLSGHGGYLFAGRSPRLGYRGGGHLRENTFPLFMGGLLVYGVLSLIK